MSRGVLLVCEDRTHHFLADRLDRLLAEEAGAARTVFAGLDERRDGYLSHKRVGSECKGRNLRLNASLGGQLRSPQSTVLRRAWLLAQFERFDAVVILWDSDNDDDRPKDARDLTRASRELRYPAAFGICHRDAEGWLLAGWEPSDAEESKRAEAAAKHLSFNPTREPHRLTAQPDAADTDAKRVLCFMLGDGQGLAGKDRAPSRALTPDELDALAPSLATLATLARFDECGVARFIRDLRTLREAVRSTST